MKLHANLVNIDTHLKKSRSIRVLHIRGIFLFSSFLLTACGDNLSNSFTGPESNTGSTITAASDTAPTASNVIIADDNGGVLNIGDTLTATYTYNDDQGDAEGTSLYRWYSDGAQIPGVDAVKTIFTVTSAESGATLTFRVIPVASSGVTTGTEVFSNGLTVGAAAPAPAASRINATALNTTPVASGAVLDTSHFRSIISANIVSCTLSNGSVTTCHELKFVSNNIVDGVTLAEIDDESGPLCPTTKTDVNSGITIYDGATGAGIQRLAQPLWDNMVADTYDIIDDNDAVCTFDNNTNLQTNGLQTQCSANCIANTPDDSIVVVHYIPVVPQNLSADDVIEETEAVGTSLDGIPITGSTPSVVTNLGDITALDACGGHHDAAGYYHWHFVPESIDAVLASSSISGIGCASTITQATSALTGYAKDGYPIYAYQDDSNVSPTGLDSCNGHTGATVEFPDGVYHYHASADTAPNVPPCLKGASTTSPGTPSFE